jgi:LysM repeat protein
MNASAAIDDFINIEGVTKEMWVDVSADVANIDYKMVNDRKISYRAVIDVTVCAESSEPHDIIVDVSGVPHNQLLRSTLNINRRIENKFDRMIIKDELAIPAGKPNIREILECGAAIANKDVRVQNGRVAITGDLLVTSLYRGDSDQSLIEFVEHEIPFNGSIEVNGARDGMSGDAVLSVQDQYIQVRPDADGEDRVLDIEVSVVVTLKVTCHDSIEILEDAYCINKTLEYTKKTVSFPKLICRNKNQNPVKEVVRLDADCPEMLQIFRVSGRVQHDETRITDDRVSVEGVIYTDILYIAGSDDSPLYNFKAILPYKQTIETKGSKDGMDVSVEINIDHVGFSMLSEKEVEIRFLLSCNTTVIDNTSADVITDIEFLEIDKSVLDKMSAMTIYVVQPGDSLWSIAKKYNAALDDLVELNDLDDPNKIYVGQRLVIVKKVYEV